MTESSRSAAHHLLLALHMMGSSRVEEALQRLKGAFLEVPGAQLTLNDAARLTGLESDVCRMILGALEDVRFLRQSKTGVFVRRSSQAFDS